MINKAFGEWDAPVTDDAEWIDTPVGNICLWCQEEIKEGDSGRIYGNDFRQTWTEHRECSFRNVMGGIGHCVDHDRYCHTEGPDAGLSRRKSSLLVWQWFQGTHMDPTPSQVMLWKVKLQLERKRSGRQRRFTEDGASRSK